MTEEQTPRLRVQHSHSDVKVTEQSHAKAVNVNTIMKKAYKTGLMPQRSTPGFYGDFTGVTDYFTAVNQIKSAENAFYTLPADIRKKFDNEPGRLLEYLDNAENEQEAIKLGILPQPAQEPAQEPVASAAEPKPDPEGTATA